MRLKKIIYSKMVCLSIVWCFVSWAFYFNFYGHPRALGILTFTPSYSIDVTYELFNTSIKTFSGMNSDYSAIEMIAFIVSILLCITAGLIIATLLHMLIKKLFIN